MWKTWLVRIAVSVLALILLGRLLAAFSSPKFDPGIRNGRLADCPTSPNCVSSQIDQSNARYVEPLQVLANAADPMSKLLDNVGQMRGSKLIAQENDYLYFEFRSLLFGFVDDVEFQLDRKRNVIHVRSASRLGYSDMGTNRKRVEQIRKSGVVTP